MPNPCPDTRWENKKGERFIVKAFLFCGLGDSIILKNERTGEEFERTVVEFKEAFKDGRLKYVPDW